MKKVQDKNNVKKLITLIFSLIAIILIVIGFVGVYFPQHNKLVNKIPDYTFGTELDGVMEYRFSPDDSEEEKNVYVDEEGNIKGEVVEDVDTTDISYSIETKNVKGNEEKNLTKENFEKVKDIINKRLEKCGAVNYNVRVNNITGDLVVELSRNNDISFLYQAALDLVGEFRVLDKQTGVILLDNTHIKNTYANAYQVESGAYVVYLQVELTETGAKILKDISNKYIEYTSSDGTTQRDYIQIKLDDLTLASSMYFSEEYNESILNIAMSDELTETEDINGYLESTTSVAEVINLGELPVKYENVSSNSSPLFIKSSIQESFVQIIFIIMYIVLVIAVVVLTIKFKSSGFIAGILNAGLIALITLVLRYLEVTITIGSLMAFFIIIGLNVMFLYIYLSKIKEEEAFLGTLKKYYSIIMPVIIISFVFTFFVNESISGIGNTLFWSLLVQIIYNFVFVRFAINDK